MAAGEEKAQPKKRHADDTEIASSIRSAMSHLRAGSLPAALVRPTQAEAEDSDPQVRPNPKPQGVEGPHVKTNCVADSLPFHE